MTSHNDEYSKENDNSRKSAELLKRSGIREGYGKIELSDKHDYLDEYREGDEQQHELDGAL